MSAIVEEGLRAGALGFSTSRTVLHRWIDRELVPGTTATKRELIRIGRAMGRVGHGVFEMASDLGRLKLGTPWLAFDPPAGGKRLPQKAGGYSVTIKSGQVTFRDGVLQRARPGRVVRGPRWPVAASPAR